MDENQQDTWKARFLLLCGIHDLVLAESYMGGTEVGTPLGKEEYQHFRKIIRELKDIGQKLDAYLEEQ
jgi:hypothetical protein